MRNAALCVLLFIPVLGCGGKTPGDAKTGEPEAKTPQENGQPKNQQPAAGPAEVARKFMAASDKGDMAAVKKLVTEKSRTFIDKNGMRKGGPKDYTLGKARITGETARVPVQPDKDEMPFPMEILLKREQGQWRVHGVSMGPLVMDFENPKSGKIEAKITGADFGSPFGDPEDKGPAPPPLKSVSIEEFNKSWQADYHYKDRMAREVLAELAKKAGMKLDEGFRPLKQLEQPISIDLKNVSLARAIEEVCRKAGVHPDVGPGFRGPSTLSVKAGARSQPPVYAGPFVVAVDSLDVAAEYGTGELQLTVAAYDLPPAVRQLRKERTGRLLTIDKLAGTNGQDVRQRQGTTWSNSGSQTIPLKNLLRDVKSIALNGKISLPLPVDVKQLRFTELKPGESKSAGEVTLTLKTSKHETLTTLHLEYQKPDSGDVRFTPLDEAGKPLRTGGAGSFTIGSRVSRQITAQGRPASLKAELGGKSATFKTLKSGQTQQLGGTEITLKKVRSTGRHELTIEFTNAESNRIFLTGLDAEGKPLHSEGGFGFSGGNRGRISKTVLGAPKEVVVSVITGLKTVEYDVALKEIPVPKADQRPEKLAPLQFTGDAPVTLETLGFSKDENFAKVKLRIKNQSNKDIRRVEMRLHYLDASGKELKSWSAQADGRFNPRGGGRAPVVKEKATAEVEVTAFFMPEGTKRVTAELQEVESADATSWRAKKKK